MDDMPAILAVQVSMVIVADDCALTEKRNVGRRGIAGTVFVHKVAAACGRLGLCCCCSKPHLPRGHCM